MATCTIRAAKKGDETLIVSLLRELAEYEKLLDRFHITPDVITRDYLGEQPLIFCDLAFESEKPAGIATWYWTYGSFAATRKLFLPTCSSPRIPRQAIWQGADRQSRTARDRAWRAPVSIGKCSTGTSRQLISTTTSARADQGLDCLQSLRRRAGEAGEIVSIISLVVAMADNGVIGKDGALPWRIPEDMRHFKALTIRKPCIMGRKTWDRPAEEAAAGSRKYRPLRGIVTFGLRVPRSFILLTMRSRAPATLRKSALSAARTSTKQRSHARRTSI
ncbi:MAG: dihydrofolate reductase [Rhizomicrobium sp.]